MLKKKYITRVHLIKFKIEKMKSIKNFTKHSSTGTIADTIKFNIKAIDNNNNGPSTKGIKS